MIQADRVYSALNATETSETVIGTITIPTQGVRHIVGVWGKLMQPTATAGEMISGHFRLALTTVSGKFKFPVMCVHGPAGTLAANAHAVPTTIIPVDIPVPANETIACYMTADIALTGTCTGEVGIIME